jgi:SAM-dependent methyltransferase
MPTLPSGAAPAPPHEARGMAESFGTDPARYDRARPGYPQRLIERIAATIPGRDVLDVGCGTGIAARQFQAAGCRVLGVDVDPRMAGFARARGLRVEVAKFEDWDPAGRRFDAVIAAQTWHWIDPVAGAAKAAGVLRPGGRIAVFRNDPRLPPRLNEAFADAYDRVLPDLTLNPHRQQHRPSHATDALSETTTRGLRQAGGFGSPERWTCQWQRDYTREEWLDELPTSGLLTRLDAAKLTELLCAIGAAIDAFTDGRFTASYTTLTVTAERIAP